MIKEKIKIKSLEVVCYPYYPINSNMYVIIKNEEAIIIDPCIDEDLLKLLKDNKVEKVIILLTHEHYDHISGVNWIRKNIDCIVICTKECANQIQDSRGNLSLYYDILFINKSEKIKKIVKDMNLKPFVCYADKFFEDKMLIEWQGENINLIRTPGHTRGSMCILFNNDFIFTGDSLLLESNTITRLPNGSKKDFFEITIPFLKSLDKNIYVFAGHGKSCIMKEFKL